MGEKKKSKNEGGEEQKKENGPKKEGEGHNSTTVVLKADLHCVGCASKVVKSIRSFEGVESVKCADGNKLTVIGKVDPVKLMEKVQQKTHKKVELVSPVSGPKKEEAKENDKKKEAGGGGEDKKDKSKEKSDDKKSKEAPVTTAVMKVNLHCEGCIQKLHKIVTKTKGYQEILIDREKNLVTVKGNMDMKALAESMKKQLKKEVEIVPAKKEGGGGKDGKKDKGGEDEHGKGGGDRKAAAGDGGGEGPKVVEGSNVGYFQYGYPNAPNPYNMYMYGSGYPVEQLNAQQMFSDENPNACSIM